MRLLSDDLLGLVVFNFSLFMSLSGVVALYKFHHCRRLCRCRTIPRDNTGAEIKKKYIRFAIGQRRKSFPAFDAKRKICALSKTLLTNFFFYLLQKYFCKFLFMALFIYTYTVRYSKKKIYIISIALHRCHLLLCSVKLNKKGLY